MKTASSISQTILRAPGPPAFRSPLPCNRRAVYKALKNGSTPTPLFRHHCCTNFANLFLLSSRACLPFKSCLAGRVRLAFAKVDDINAWNSMRRSRVARSWDCARKDAWIRVYVARWDGGSDASVEEMYSAEASGGSDVKYNIWQ